MAGLSTGAHIVKLYHEKSMILPDVSRVLACLYEKDIEFKTRTASYKSLLRLQALTHAPVPFYDGPTFLEESREICRYIAETYQHHGYPFLLGKDALERASIEQWLHNEEHAFNPPSRSLFCHLAFPLDEDAEDDDIDLHKRKLEEVLEVYEQRLGDSEFLAGNKFTLADLVHLPNSHYITASDKFVYLYDSRKNVQRWWNAISTRDSWQKVLRDIKKVEQQRKQEELEKQQHQKWQREHPTTTGRQIRLDPWKHASTKSKTILVPPPVGIISTSPTAPRAEKSHPTETFRDATVHAQTSPRSAKEDSEQLSASDFSKNDSTATSVGSQDNESVRYTERTPQRPAETIYGRSTVQRAADTSPGKLCSTEADQKLQAEQWHAATAGFSNLNGDSDHLMPTQKVKPSKDVQQHTSQDSEQASTGPLAQEPVSMDDQLVEGPEMTSRIPHNDQRREISSMLWQQAADARGISEDEASSDHREAVLPHYTGKHAEEAKIVPAGQRKAAPLPKHATDEDAHATQFHTAYDVAHDTTKEARETATEPRQAGIQDTHDTPEGIGIYEDTTEEAQGTFEETKPDSASSRVQPLDSQRDDAPSWKKEATEDPHRVTSSFKKRHSDVEGSTKQSSDNAFKSKQIFGQDAQGTFEETRPGDSALLREQPLDTWQAATAPTDQAATQDGLSLTPPSDEKYPSDEDTSKQHRGTASTPRRIAAQDGIDTFEVSKPADPVSSWDQPLSAWRPAVRPPGQGIKDSPSTVAPFQKRYPYVEDNIKQAGDTAYAPRQIAAEDTKDAIEGTKVVDSALFSTKPTHTLRAALPLSQQAEAEDTQDKGRKSRETISAPKKIASIDSQDTYGERNSTDSTSREQSLDRLPASSPSRQPGAEDARGAVGRAKESSVDERNHSEAAKGTAMKSGGTFGETKGPSSILLPSKSLAQDVQRTNGTSRTPIADQRKDVSTQLQSDVQDIYKQPKSSSAHRKGLGASLSQAEAGNDAQAIMSEKTFSTELHGQMLKESQSTPSRAQPKDSRGSIKVEKTPSVHQKDPLIAQDSHEQAQTLSIGVKADGSTPKRQQAPVIPSTSDEKLTPEAPSIGKVRDGHGTEEPIKKDTVDDKKEEPPLLGQEPISQVQRATELLQEAAPDRDMSSKSSTINQWWRASVPLEDVTLNSGDDVLDVSTADQKSTPMSQQAILSARGANDMIKRPVEQRVEPPAPVGTQTSDVQRAPQSFPGGATTERAGEPDQRPAPILNAHPTSAPTKRATPNTHETSDQEFVSTSDGQIPKASKARHDSAVIHEDVHDASLSTHGAPVDDKISTIHASEAQGLHTRPGSTQIPMNARRTSGDELVRRYLRDQGAQPPESTQAQTPLESSRDSVSTQDVPSDAFSKTEFAKSTSTDQEGMVPTVGPASTLDPKLAAGTLRAQAAHAEQKIAPPDKRSTPDTQSMSSDESRIEDTSVSAADQTKTPRTIFRQKTKPTEPTTREVPTSDTQHVRRKIQKVDLDNLPTDDSAIPPVPSQEQVSHAPQTILGEKDTTSAPGTRDSPAQVASLKVQEGDYGADELKMTFIPSENQGSYIGSSTEPHEGPSPDAHGSVVDKETTKSPSRQAQGLKARPGSTPTHGYARISPDQRGQSPTADQATYFEAPRDSVSTQDVLANALGNNKELEPHSTDQEATSFTAGPASHLDAQPDSATGEVAPAAKKYAPSDQDLVHSAQQPYPAKPRKKETTVATAEQTKAQPTIIGHQGTQGMREAPTSDTRHASLKIQEVAPDVDLDKSVPSQERVSQAGHTSESREGLTPHADGSVVHEKAAITPASLTSNSDAALDSTPTHGDVHPTSGTEHGAEPPSATQAPKHLEALDSVYTEDILVDASGIAQSMRPSASDAEHGRHDEVPLAGQKFAPSDQDSAHSTQPPSSAEPRNEEIKDSVRSAQPVFSAAFDQTKDSQTSIGQQDISPAPEISKSPSSDTHHASGKFQEVAPNDHHIDGSIPSQGQFSRAEPASEPREDQNLDAHSAIVGKTTRPLSIQAQSLDSKPDSTPNRSDEPSTRFLPGKVPQQHAQSQAPPPLMDLHDSISTQVVHADTIGKAKPLKPPSIGQEAMAPTVASALAPDAQRGSTPGEISHTGQKLILKDQDSTHSAQKSSPSVPTKEQTTVAAPDQSKVSQTIFGQQDISPALTKTKDPSSDTQHASWKLQEVTPKDHLIDGSTPSQEQVRRVGHASEPHEGPTPDPHGAIVEEPIAHTTGPTLVPRDQHGMGSGELSPDGNKFEASDQDSGRYSQLPASAGPRKENVAADDQIMAAPGTNEASGEVLEVGPGDHRSKLPSFIEPTKEESIVAEAEQSKVPQSIIGQQDTRHVPDISELVPDDDHNEESVSSQEQVSPAQPASELRQKSAPDVRGDFINKSTTTPPSHTQNSDAKLDSPPTPVDVDPSSGDQSTPRYLPDQGAQLPATTKSPPPFEGLSYSESTQDVPADALGKAKSLEPFPLNQEVMSPTVIPGSAPDTQLGTAPDEVAPDEQNFAPSDQHLARSAQPPFFANRTKEETIVSSSDQTNGAREIIGQQDKMPATDTEKTASPKSYTQNASRKIQETALGDDRIDESPHDAVSTQDVPSDAFGKTELAKSTSADQEGMVPTAGSASTLDPQLAAGTLRAEATHAEQKIAPSDKRSTPDAQSLSSEESRIEDTSVSAADQTKTPGTIFRQQATPTASTTREVPTSDTQHVIRKIQKVDLDNLPTSYSAIPPVPGQEQVSHAPQTIPGEKDMTSAPGTRDSQASDAQLASRKVREDDYRTDELKMTFVSSENQGSYIGSSTEPHERQSPDAHGPVVDKETIKSPSRQAQGLEARPDSTQTHGYARPTSGEEPGISPDQRGQSPTADQATYFEAPRDYASTQDVPANTLGNIKELELHSIDQEATSFTAGPASHLDTQPDSATGEVAPAAKKYAPSDQDSVHSTQQPSPAEPRKEETTVAAADQTKALPTIIDQQDIQGMGEAPTSDTQHALWKIREVAPDVDLDRSVPSQERVSQAGHTSESREEPTPHAHGAVIGEKTTPPLVIEAHGLEAGPDSTPAHGDAHPTSGDKPATRLLSEQETETSPASQGSLPFEALHDSTSTRNLSADAFGKVEPLKATGDGEVTPVDQNIPPSELPSFTEPTKEESIVAEAEQSKVPQPIIGQQDTRHVPDISELVSDDDHNVESASSQEQVSHAQPASEPRQRSAPDVRGAFINKKTTTPPSQAQSSDKKLDLPPTRDDVDLSRGDQSTQRYLPESLKPFSLVQEVISPTVIPGSTPATQLGTAPDEVAPNEQNFALSDQDLARSAQPPFSAEPRKEETFVAASNHTNAAREIIGQQDIMPATDKEKTPSSKSYTQHASRKIQETSLDDDRIDESLPSQEQVSLGGHASEPREGTATASQGSIGDDSITRSPSSQPKISDAGSDLGPTHHHAHPPTGDEPTIRIIPEQGMLPPATTQDVSADASGKAKSIDQDATALTVDLASAPDTRRGTPGGEAAASEQNYAITADQPHVPQTILDHQIITPASDARESLRKVLEASHDDLHASELAKPPNVRQEQVSQAGSASEQHEEPTPDVHGAVVDGKVPLPSSQAQNSDTKPDSTPILGDAHLTSGNGPATSSLHNPQALSPAGTQAPPVEALGSPAFIQNVSADSFEKPRPPSTDQEVMAPMTSLVPAPDAPQGTAPGEATPAEQEFTPLDQDSTHSTQLSNVAKADQTNVSQAFTGPDAVPSAAVLGEPTSSDTTHPSEKIQEFTPDACLTESAKSLLPMKGIDEVQPPDEASIDLSSDEKTTMAQHDQADTLSNANVSTNQAVGQSESSVGKAALSEGLISSYAQDNLEETSTEQQSMQQQQTDQSSTQSSKGDNKEANIIGTSNILTTSGGIQPSPPKEIMEATEDSRNQQQSDQAVFRSSQDNEKQVTEAQDTGIDELEEMNLHQNTDQKNTKTYQGEILDQSGKQASEVQLLSKNTKNGSKSTKDAPSGILRDNKSENSLRVSDESKQVQTEGGIQGGESKAPASKTEQLKQIDLPANSNRGISRQSQEEASDKSEEQTSPSIQNMNKNSSKLDGSTNDTKPRDMEDSPSS